MKMQEIQVVLFDDTTVTQYTLQFFPADSRRSLSADLYVETTSTNGSWSSSVSTYRAAPDRRDMPQHLTDTPHEDAYAFLAETVLSQLLAPDHGPVRVVSSYDRTYVDGGLDPATA